MPSPSSAEAEAEKATIGRIQAFLDAYQTTCPDNFDADLYKPLRIISAQPENRAAGTPARVVYKTHIPPRFLNNKKLRTTHGGATAALLDVLTSISCIAASNFVAWGGGSTGVSRVLQCTYLRPIVQGEGLVVECEVLQLAKGGLATIRGAVRRESDGTTLVLCQHEKFRVGRPVPIAEVKL